MVFILFNYGHGDFLTIFEYNVAIYGCGVDFQAMTWYTIFLNPSYKYLNILRPLCEVFCNNKIEVLWKQSKKMQKSRKEAHS